MNTLGYLEFVIRYVRNHPQLSDEQLAGAIPVAWNRYQNSQPYGDVLQWWMQDTAMMLGIERALRSI